MTAVDQVFKEESMGRGTRVSLGSLLYLLWVQNKEQTIFRRAVSQSAMVVEACNLSTWEVEAEDQEPKVRLSYTVDTRSAWAAEDLASIYLYIPM